MFAREGIDEVFAPGSGAFVAQTVNEVANATKSYGDAELNSRTPPKMGGGRG